MILHRHRTPKCSRWSAFRHRSIWTASFSAPVQSYLSTSHDPHVNLSIEHRLLQSTAPDSTVLFFFTNFPTVVIGRNQNPWLETSLSGMLPAARDGSLRLVRRRSGGGTVFHDLGNVNWTVISPTKNFARDTHAELVVRALRACGVARARVNERHDIVLDQGKIKEPYSHKGDRHDEHWTPWMHSTNADERALKCSGSAFKLIRHRALHHGTCLLHSENLQKIGQLLRSEGKPYIQAKGVESVSSPIANTGLSHGDFIDAVRDQFSRLYSSKSALKHVDITAEEALLDGHIDEGSKELKSPEWTFGQTPRFSFRVNIATVAELQDLPPITISMDIAKGLVTSLELSCTEDQRTEAKCFRLDQVGSLFDDSLDWTEVLERPAVRCATAHDARLRIARWLQRVLPSTRIVTPA